MANRNGIGLVVDEILMDASDQCESANYHDRCGLPNAIYEEIVAAIPKLTTNQRVKIAKAIANNITEGM